MPTFTNASKKLFALIISCIVLMVIGRTAQSQSPLQVEATANHSSTCTQGAVELNADATGGTGDYNYSWVGNPGNFTSSIQNPTVFPNVSSTTVITYTVYVNDGENIAQDDIVVTVIANPEADAGADASLCETENYYPLNGEVTDSETIQWSTAGDGTFGSPGSLQTSYEPGEQDRENGSVQITLHAFAMPPCTGFDSDQMTLNITPQPTVDAGANQNICENETIQLSGNVSNASQVTWSAPNGDGVFGNPNSPQTSYTPGESDINSGSVTLTLTAEPEEPCTEAVTDQLEVDITNLPTADAGPDDTICEGNTYTPFQANAQYYSTVSWSSNGDGEFENPNSPNPIYIPGSNDIGSGEVVLTLTASGQQACDEEVSDEMTLTINYPPEVDAGEDASICESGTYQLQPTVQYSNEVQWTTSGDGTFVNNSDTTENAVYEPGTNDTANDEVVLTITAQPIAPCEEPVSDEMTLSLEPLPIVEAGENGEICDNGSYQLNGDTIYSDSVYWSSAGNGTFDDSTQINATYFPVEEDGQNGAVTLTLSATPVSPCSGTIIQDSMQLDILPSPFVYAGSDNTICETGTFIPNDADVADADTYYWSTTGDGNFVDDDTLNTLTPEYNPAVDEDSVYLVLTGENANCSDNRDSLLLTIQGEPVAYAGEDTSKCLQEEVTPQFTLNGSVENSDNFVWSVEDNGIGSFDSTENILDPVFTFGPQGMENQSATLTLTANPIGPCSQSDSDEVELTFSLHPTASTGEDGVICEGADSIQLDGNVSHESTLIWQRIPDTLNSGQFSSQVVENPVYYPSSADFEAGEIKLMLQAFGAGDCNQVESRDTVIYSVQKLPVADAGGDMTICEEEMAEISDAEAQHYGSVQWDALNGSGSFSDENSLTTGYNPSSGDLVKDSIALKLSAWAVDPCETPDSDTLILTINKNPAVDFGGNFVACSSNPILLDNIAVSHYSNISWSTSGDGSFTGSYPEKYYIVGEEDMNNGQMTISLTAESQNGCSGAVSDSGIVYLEEGPTIQGLTGDTLAAFNNTIKFEPTVTGFSDTFIFEWTPGDVFNDSTNKEGEIKPIMYHGSDTSFSVHLRATDPANHCYAIDTVIVRMELKAPIIGFTDDTIVCQGSPLEFSSLLDNVSRGSGHFTYTWISGSNEYDTTVTLYIEQDANYQLRVEDKDTSFTATKGIDIYVNSADKPQIREEESNVNVIEYSRATYEPLNNDTEETYYEWSALNGSVVQGQGTPQATIEWGVVGPGEVYLKKTTPFGCFGESDTLKVNIGVDAIQEITAIESLKIYPNPVKDELNITFYLKEAKEVEFVLFNSMGKALQQREIEDKLPGQQKFHLNMSRYDSGLFLLKLRVGEESVLKRIIRIK